MAAPTSKVKEVAGMLEAIHAPEDRAAAQEKTEQVAANLKEIKLADAVAGRSPSIEFRKDSFGGFRGVKLDTKKGSKCVCD